MAVWQFVIQLKCGKKKAKSLDFRHFAELFPEEKSWHSGTRQFGSLDSTCLELFAGEELSLRLDLRSLTREQLEGIVAFAAENGLKLKHKGKLYEPSYESFAALIKASDAYRFVSSPEEFFEGLEQQKDSE